MKRFFLILFLVFCILGPTQAKAATSAGFINSSIWYSKDPFEEGDKIKIYTVIFNPDTRELSGTVLFFDKTVLLGKKTFTIPAKGVKDVSVDWTVTLGSHDISAKIEDAKFLVSAGKYENVNLPENQSEESVRNVSKKIIPKEGAATKETAATNTSQIDNIEGIIAEKTPNFISKPIVSATNSLEGFRVATDTKIESKKDEAKSEITGLGEDKVQTTSKTEKPLKYLRLYFFSLLSFIFSHKLVFYGLSLLIAFSIIRSILAVIF